MKPAAGRYFVIARKSAAGSGSNLAPGDLYAYFDGNPVIVGESTTTSFGINCSPVIDVGEKKQTRRHGHTRQSVPGRQSA